jgi:hypothetical protein
VTAESQNSGTSRDAIIRERFCKHHVTAGYCGGDRGNATIEELWEEVFSVPSSSRGQDEARNRTCKRLKLGGSQA